MVILCFWHKVRHLTTNRNILCWKCCVLGQKNFVSDNGQKKSAANVRHTHYVLLAFGSLLYRLLASS